MTRVFLAASVAVLAIAAPASAGPRGQGPGQNFGSRAAGGAHGGGFAVQRMQMRAPRMASPRAAAPREPRARPSMPQRQPLAFARPQRSERAVTRRQPISRSQSHMAAREPAHSRMSARAERRIAARQQVRTPGRLANQEVRNRTHARTSRIQQAQNLRLRTNGVQNQRARGGVANTLVPTNRVNAGDLRARGQAGFGMRRQLRSETQRANRSLLAQRGALRPEHIANSAAFEASRLNQLARGERTHVIAPAEAVRFVGQPVRSVTNYVTLNALPASVSYLYPSTPAYYYQYGGGYLYQVDRSTSLIDALIPLLAGGFLPGTYLPTSYMASYAPSYYGLDTFYPANYGGTCNRYAYGVIYQVDCFTGLVENVVPTYAGGYGVGQLLPSAYAYYNVPMQYRSLYYPTADYSYWYAPGAIYQYDQSTSLITSVAALMSPGFTVGQPLPAGYEVYNVPYDFRATYYDSPAAWYRYNNGYIYQVDPSTMLVTGIAASLLT
jgi:hypothetical protein